MLIDMMSTRLKLVPFVLLTTGALACLFSGCEKAAEEAPVAPVRSSSLSDPAFLKELDVRRRERQELSVTRGRLVAEMEKMVDAMRKQMPQADDAAVKAELEKSAEWKSLFKRVEDLNQAIDENRQRAIKSVREQVKGGRPQSDKISK